MAAQTVGLFVGILGEGPWWVSLRTGLGSRDVFARM